MKKNGGNGSSSAPLPVGISDETAFGYPRDFLQNRFVYLVISPRAGGLSVGVNLNPVLNCNFNCLYCEVDRAQPARASALDIDRMSFELQATLELVRNGSLSRQPRYAGLPEDLLEVRHVALSGDGEPTLAAGFGEAVQSVTHVRTMGHFFKIVLVTNSTALDGPQAQDGLRLLTRQDEVWAKLDGGTQEYIARINGATVSLKKILANILLVARRRPVIIQSLFPAIHGEPPPAGEIREYAIRLKELKQNGAEIPLVQIYSATRPMARAGCTHLPLKELSEIARTVRQIAGLRAEVF
ncbi:MAG: radical SAM protein [Verrucomicrobia bacterium]|nr:radical SAM protein [Verrucomicrobiota bacterium]MDE3099636.1 radical SAM protein [Verrucomicrobiota bacterium]